VPEKDSSSLNAELFPTSYTVLSAVYSRSGESVRLSLSHDEQLVLPADRYALLRVGEGSVLKRAALLELKQEELIFRTKQKAIALLERRPFTVSSLAAKLGEYLFPKEVIMTVVRELTDVGYLDDGKYGENWVISQLKRKPVGRIVLSHGLRRKGIAPPLAEKILDSVYPAGVEIEYCEKALLKLQRRKVSDKRKLFAALSRLGFAAPVVKQVLAQAH
jgi:regulatory protein